MIQPVEVAAIDLAAVGKTEQARRVEPDPVRLLARGVVLIGMPEGALALEVIRGRCRLGQSGYHDTGFTYGVACCGYAIDRVQTEHDHYRVHGQQCSETNRTKVQRCDK